MNHARLTSAEGTDDALMRGMAMLSLEGGKGKDWGAQPPEVGRWMHRSI